MRVRTLCIFLCLLNSGLACRNDEVTKLPFEGLWEIDTDRLPELHEVTRAVTERERRGALEVQARLAAHTSIEISGYRMILQIHETKTSVVYKVLYSGASTWNLEVAERHGPKAVTLRLSAKNRRLTMTGSEDEVLFVLRRP